MLKKIAAVSEEIVAGWTSLYNELYGTKLTNELTLREYEAARLVWRGLGNAEIARHMNISLNTVKLYMKAIYMKLDVNSREEISPYIWK
nr:helix-turn-helix transcriptional regulator [Cloacibacillus evryensis]